MEMRETLYKEWMAQFDKDNLPSMRAAFNAGMDAASTPWRTEWHDLYKNPDDLPKIAPCDEYSAMSVDVVITNRFNDMTVAHYDFLDRCWRDHSDGVYDDTIAWMELPEWEGGEE